MVWELCFDLNCHEDPRTGRIDLYPPVDIEACNAIRRELGFIELPAN
jgi:hypothetical protein